MPNKKIFTLFLIFALNFVPISPLRFIAHSQTADGYEHITGYQEWNSDKAVSSPIIVDPEATLVIKKGVTITFAGASIDVQGTLITEGTQNENVKFKKGDGYSNFALPVESSGKMIMRNTDVSGGGASVGLVRNNTILNAADAFYQGGIQINGGALDVEGCNFHDNDVAIYIMNSGYDKIKVNRTKFENNKIVDVFIRGSYSKLPNFQYDWWGSADGPDQSCYTYGTSKYCYYTKIDGDIDSSNFLKDPNFHDPVIIVPGIMGTVDFMGNKILVPMVYDWLYDTFKENGYTPGKDLFKFPYEWRDSNIDNAKLLRDKINEVKQIANWPEVDVVAHSMGGLLTRQYIESDYYQNDVDQLVTLGTPENGAPTDYLTWEGGKLATSYSDIMDLALQDIFLAESKENGYANLFDYLKNRPITSVQELLPTYDYLWDTTQNAMRSYPSGYPANQFLENLNSAGNVSKLSPVVFTNIVGNLKNDTSTVDKIRVGNIDSPGSLWEYGYPENFDSVDGDHGLEKGKGDGTVPLESATDIPSYEEKEIDSSHMMLPTNAADLTYETITGNAPSHLSSYMKIGSMLLFQVFSPIDIQIVAPDGKRIGKDFDTGNILNEIDGAYYSGYDTNSEFVAIPNPTDGEYKILTQGTGDGAYHIEATKISENPDDLQNAVESSGTIEGMTTVGAQDEKTVVVSGNDVVADKDTTPPVITINVPEDGKEYLNDQILKTDYKAEDDKSAPDKISSEVYLDDQKIDDLSSDLSLQKTGDHKIKISATDEAQNSAEKEVSFKVAADIDSIISNVSHYSDLGMIKRRSEKMSLLQNLRMIKMKISFMEKWNNSKIADRVKKAIVAYFERDINRNIDILISRIGRKNNRGITDQGKELLIDSLKFIKCRVPKGQE